jgi:hypothetical protein
MTAIEMQKQGRQMKLARLLSWKTMLTSHWLPSIEKIKPVAYGDVGNKQTDRQLQHKDQAPQPKKCNSAHCWL